MPSTFHPRMVALTGTHGAGEGRPHYGVRSARVPRRRCRRLPHRPYQLRLPDGAGRQVHPAFRERCERRRSGRRAAARGGGRCGGQRLMAARSANRGQGDDSGLQLLSLSKRSGRSSAGRHPSAWPRVDPVRSGNTGSHTVASRGEAGMTLRSIALTLALASHSGAARGRSISADRGHERARDRRGAHRARRAQMGGETEATDYTPLEAEGRRLFLQSGCTYCHSQYSRPVESEIRPWGTISTDPRRWGPEPEPGEYAFDVPPAFGNQGIAPDSARVGLKYGNEWHLAHFWNPRWWCRDRSWAAFPACSTQPAEPVRVVDGDAAGPHARAHTDTERLFDFASQEQIKLTPNEQGLLFVPMSARGKYPLIWTPNDEYTGETVKLVAETPAIQALAAYVQKLGTNRGRWREVLEPDWVGGTGNRPAALGREDRPGQEGLRAPLPRLPRGQGRRQRPRRDLHPRAAPPQLHLWRVQVQADQGAIAFRYAICCGRSPAAYGARQCRRGTSCRSRTAWR